MGIGVWHLHTSRVTSQVADLRQAHPTQILTQGARNHLDIKTADRKYRLFLKLRAIILPIQKTFLPSVSLNSRPTLQE